MKKRYNKTNVNCGGIGPRAEVRPKNFIGIRKDNAYIFSTHIVPHVTIDEIQNSKGEQINLSK
jgi:hypothetical protein